MNKNLKDKLYKLIDLFDKYPDFGVFLDAKFQATVMLMCKLEKIIENQNNEPYSELNNLLNALTNYFSSMTTLKKDINIQKNKEIILEHNEKTALLFENAWTVYTPETYEHSVKLIEKRFFANGFDKNFFKGKICFDGGCGTGRLSIAMAKLGAKKVVATDIGGKSLNYFNEVIKRYNLKNIEIKKMDITDLSCFKSDSFDFVASYGVLHHTKSPDKGLKEHLRITSSKNGILWLYLYGAGGFYWDVYDTIKKIVDKWDIKIVKQKLLQAGLREGLIYTYLDNVLAPRKYYYVSEIVEMFSKINKINWDYAKGVSFIDDPLMSINSKYGKEILGPEGEVRLIIKKNEV